MNVEKLFSRNLTPYQSIPFWSWNDQLETEELREQIRSMKKAGIGGFFMHARGGLMTEYMGEEWFEAVEACIDEAKKQGMDAWCYDENGWPSGFAGMKLLEDPANFAHLLVMEEKEEFDPQALACYRVENGSLVRVFEQDGKKCSALYDRVNTSVVDILNPEIVQKFLKETHDRYYERCAKDFGGAMVGFFTDEPQYFRYETAYSPVILKAYQEEYHEDLLDELGALLLDCAQSNRLRLRYWRLMNKLFTESFAGQIYEWCQNHRCQLTGHAIEEDTLFGQMIGCAGIMPFYEYEHIPGMDWLGREIKTEMAPRQLFSACQQLGKKHILTETFACAGWDITPRQLKRIAEWQYVNGVNLMCQHLYPYSIRGQRKRDYPAFYSNHNPWIADFKAFNDYFTHLGVLLAESREEADVVVIHPMHSAYLTYKRGDRHSTDELNARFESLIEKLGAANIGHHYVDENMLASHGSVEGDCLVVGLCRYHKVVIPQMDNLDAKTAEMLKTFVENGGKIWLQGECPRLCDGEEAEMGFVSNMTFEELAHEEIRLDCWETEIRSTLRRSEFGDFLYAVNLSKDKTYSVKYSIKSAGAASFDVQNREKNPICFEKDGEWIHLPLTLRAGESVVIFLEEAQSAEKKNEPQMHSIAFDKAELIQAGPNALTLDRAALSEDGGKTYRTLSDVMEISDRLLRRRKNGTVHLKYVFEAADSGISLVLEAEKMNARAVWCNGEALDMKGPGTLDKAFVRADLTGKIREGENEIVFEIDYQQSEHVYRVFNGVYYDQTDMTESLVNCLSYETDIEAVYLLGDFSVQSKEMKAGEKGTIECEGDFALAAPQKMGCPENLTTKGFPFFGGSVTFNIPFEARGDETVLKLCGHFATAKVSINESAEKLVMFSDTLDVSGMLKAGENQLRVTITGSLRNLMGPFHGVDPEPAGVYPDFFTCYGSWKDGKSAQYKNRYAFVPFGLSGAEIG